MKRWGRAFFGFFLFLSTNAFSETKPLGYFKVATFNAWLLPPPFVKKFNERLSALPSALAGTGADIITLQEVWDVKARSDLVKKMVRFGYRFAAYKQTNTVLNSVRGRGILGNGLLIFSKFPVVGQTDQLTFQEYTSADEYFSIKGAIHTEIEIPHFGLIDVFDSHVGAVSFDPKIKMYSDWQIRNRDLQIKELVEFVARKKKHALQILGVDLNMHPLYYDSRTATHHSSKLSGPYAYILNKLNFWDTFHLFVPLALWDTLLTFNPMKNEWAANGDYGTIPAEYEDYLFVSSNSAATPISSEIVLDQRVKPLGFHISDHFGVLSTFRIDKN